MSALNPIDPKHAQHLVALDRAVIIDVREADEYARRHIPGAINQPLSALERAHLQLSPGHEVIFTCRSGNRTAMNCDRLAALTTRPAHVLTGGMDGWTAAGLPVVEDRKAPLEMMRQVQIVAGVLILTGVALSLVVAPAFIALSAFVGAGLTFAGATGWCGMAKLLAVMPWNRPAAA